MNLKNRILEHIENTGSTWLGVSDNENIADDDIVYRTHKGKRYATHKWYSNCERNVAKLLNGMMQMFDVDDERINTLIEEYETNNQMKLADEQKEGVRMICKNRICILTGGAGTGKTSVLKCAVVILHKLNPRFSFAFTAPTGKAAKRITESTGYHASTVQKKIGDTGNGNLQKVVDDALVVDEASMLDLETFEKIVICLSSVTRLILLGDVNQLPSVEEGAVLRDLIDSGCVATTQLEKTFRQDNSSKLFENIQIVKKGGYIPLEEGTDFLRIKSENNIFNVCVDRYIENVKKYGKEQTVLLTPNRKVGKVCSEKLNSVLQEKINPNGYEYQIEVRRDGRLLLMKYRVGDPVIHLRNRNGIANGDTGTVIAIKGKTVYVLYGNTQFAYRGAEELADLDLAYALSINKSQGSEYKCAIIPLLRENKNLDRNMIYTAITRAKEVCEVIGFDETIDKACKLHSSWERTTFLCEEIQLMRKATDIVAQILY